MKRTNRTIILLDVRFLIVRCNDNAETFSILYKLMKTLCWKSQCRLLHMEKKDNCPWRQIKLVAELLQKTLFWINSSRNIWRPAFVFRLKTSAFFLNCPRRPKARGGTVKMLSHTISIVWRICWHTDTLRKPLQYIEKSFNLICL